MDISTRINQVLSLDPEAEAIEFNGCWRTWGDLKARMEAISARLEIAIQPSGAQIGIVLRNRPAILSAALAVLSSRRCIVTLNPMQPVASLAADICDLRLPVLIADAEDWTPDMRQAAEKTGAIAICVNEEGANLISDVPGLTRIGPGPHRPPTQGIAVEMLTSGTTGAPKRIPLRFDSLNRSIANSSHYEARGGSEVLELKKSGGVHWTPLAHIGGLWYAIFSIVQGRKFALMERFDVQEWHKLIIKHRPKFVSMPPTALRMVLDARFSKEDFQSLIAMRTGAAPLDPDLADQFFERYSVPILNAYGATEFAGAVAGWTLKDFHNYGRDKRGSVGRAHPGVEMRVINESSGKVPERNETGILEVKSTQIADPATWVRTTDLARIDDDGFLYIMGRADNAIIRGGFKIAPAHVAAMMETYPGIREACIVAQPDERLGQVPVAAFEFEGDAPPDSDKLKNFLRHRLKPYEIPVFFRAVDALPRTSSMKVSLVEVKNMFAN